MRLVSIAARVASCVAVVVLAWPTRSVVAADKVGPLLDVLDCNASVSEENKHFGFGAKLDMSCTADPSDCFQSVCRMCKERDNNDTKLYRHCDDIGQTTEAAAADFESDLDFDPDQVFKVELAQEAATVTSADCAARVASGDRGVGVSAVYDSACANGGLGCFGSDRCRYCRETTTKQSEVFLSCSELSAASTSAGASTQTACDAATKNSGLSDVSFVVDALCQTSARLSGCVAASSCRLCRDAKNEGNQFLCSCKVLRQRQQLAATTATTTTATTMSSASSNSTPAVDDGPGVGAACASAVTAIVIALAAVAVRKSRARRIANATATEDGGEMHRIDSMLQDIGRDRIATL